MAVPVREEGVNHAIGTFKTHAGQLGREKAAEFEKERDKVAKEKDPQKRCAAYYQLEREIIKADLHFQEQADPGSTWQTQVEFAVEDALPRKEKKGDKNPLSPEEWAQNGQFVRGVDGQEDRRYGVLLTLAAGCQNQAQHLRDSYAVCVKGNAATNLLKSDSESDAAAIKEMPSCLQAMLKATVLVPLQKKIRALGKDTANEPRPSFQWKRDFTADAFDQTVRAAAKLGVIKRTKDAEKVYDDFKSYIKAYLKQIDKKKSKDRNQPLARH